MIEILGLTKKFDKKIVLSNINLTLDDGKVYALIGKSGSGDNAIMMTVQ